LEVTQKLVSVLKILSEPYNPETVASWTSGMISLKLGRYREQIQQHLKVSLSTLRPMKTLLLMAALYHDSGKPLTYQIDENNKIHFYGHASIGADLVSQRGSELRLSNGEVTRLRLIVRHHMRPLFLAENESPPSRRAIYRFFRDCGEAGVDVCLLSLADTLGTYGPEVPNDQFTAQLDTVRALMSAYWENKEQYIAPPTLLNGYDIMEQFRLTPGPQIGDLLEMLREAQVMGIVSDRQEALRFIEARLEESA
jgi:poly(A) polymerase